MPTWNSSGLNLSSLVESQDTTNGVLTMTIIVLLSLYIFVVNTLTILAIWRTQRLRTISNMLVTSLSVGDLLLGLLMPLGVFIRASFSESIIITSKLFCYVFILLFVILNSQSFLTITLIGVERFIYIVHPLKYPLLVTKNNVLIGIIFTWVDGFIMAGAVYISLRENTECAVSSTMLHVSVLIYAILAVIVGVMYSYITLVAFRQLKSIQVQQSSVSLRRSSFKAVKLFLAVYSLFLACWIPFYVLQAVATPLAKSVANILAFVSSGLNFSVYVLMNPAFRTAVKKLFHFKSSNRIGDSFTINNEVR